MKKRFIAAGNQRTTAFQSMAHDLLGKCHRHEAVHACFKTIYTCFEPGRKELEHARSLLVAWPGSFLPSINIGWSHMLPCIRPERSQTTYRIRDWPIRHTYSAMECPSLLKKSPPSIESMTISPYPPPISSFALPRELIIQYTKNFELTYKPKLTLD